MFLMAPRTFLLTHHFLIKKGSLNPHQSTIANGVLLQLCDSQSPQSVIRKTKSSTNRFISFSMWTKPNPKWLPLLFKRLKWFILKFHGSPLLSQIRLISIFRQVSVENIPKHMFYLLLFELHLLKLPQSAVEGN